MVRFRPWAFNRKGSLRTAFFICILTGGVETCERRPFHLCHCESAQAGAAISFLAGEQKGFRPWAT